jgi:uncharacterized repeat protein (TIGR02543 family)
VQLTVKNPDGCSVELTSTDLNPGEPVTAVAHFTYIHEFVGWFDGDTLMSESPTYTFIVPTSPIILEAKFNRVLFKLTIITKTPETTTTKSQYYSEKEQVDIGVQESEYYDFEGWKTEDSTLVSENFTDVFTVPNIDTTLIANFVAIDVNLSVSPSNSENGSISEYQKTVKSGSVITLNAQPALKCIFSGWFSQDQKLYESTDYSFKIKKQDVQIVAQFERLYTFAASINSAGGSISGTTNGDYLPGSKIEVVAEVNTTFDFGGWYQAKNQVKNHLTYSFDMPEADVEIVAKIGRIYNYTVKSYNDEMGVVAGYASGTFSTIKPITLSASPSAGYVFDGWYTEKVRVGGSTSFSLETQEGDVNLIARFNMEGLKFVLQNDAYYIDSYSGSLTSFVVPDMYNGKPIGDFSIKSTAFGGGTLGTVVLPSIAYNLTSRDQYPFNGSTIEKVIVSEGAQNIGIKLFGACTIGSIQLPDSIINIQQDAFNNCKISEIELPENLETIGATAFNSTSIETITIPSKVTYIPSSAFRNSALLKEVVFSGNVETISSDAFADCVLLESITLPNTLKSISNNAFYKCESLTSIIIPESVTSIGNTAFRYCINLESVVLNGKIDTIKIDTFGQCSKLKYVTLNESVKTIEQTAFADCVLLESIALPKSLITIGTGAFYKCESLTEVVIPESVTSIGSRAYQYCSSLESVVVNGKIDTIKSYTFNQCKKLKNVTLNESVKTIEEYAFLDSTGLTNIYNGEGVTRIDMCAFSSTSLVKFPFPYVETIKWSAFSSCSKLEDVTLKAIRVIELNAFAYCTALLTINLSGTLQSIAQNAFRDCSNVTSIIINEGVQKLEKEVFVTFTSLKRIYIPASFTDFSVDPFGGFRSKSYDYVWFLSASVTSFPAYLPATTIGSLVLASNITSITPNITIGNIFSLNTDVEQVNLFKASYKKNTNFYAYSEVRQAGDYWCYVDGIPTKWADIPEDS